MAVRRSLDSVGLLLRREIHGTRENPVLMQTSGATIAVLDWRRDLASMICAFLVGQTLADQWLCRAVTAGHLLLDLDA